MKSKFYKFLQHLFISFPVASLTGWSAVLAALFLKFSYLK
ncbi:hypothetical protein P7266_1910 [Lactococcus cremoris]|nr:hypothetical protein P7266_1910 [Lactococcus cremoris]